MRRPLVLAFVLVAGCSPKGRETEVRFHGYPSGGVYALESRAITEHCPMCGKPVAADASRCAAEIDGKVCGQLLRHPAKVACGACRGSRACFLCTAFETAGNCRFCSGAGTRRGGPCFACGGTGACAACAGFAACDVCGGKGEVSVRPSPRPPPRPPRAPSVRPAAVLVDHDHPLIWLGESVVLPRLSDVNLPWTVSAASQGPRGESEKVAPNGRFTPSQAGFYRATLGGHALFFDVIEAEVRVLPAGEGAKERRFAATVSFSPKLVDAKLRWKCVNPDGLVTWRDGAALSTAAEGWGEHRAWPAITVTGLPERLGPRPAVLSLSSLSIKPPAGTDVRSGAPVRFEALSSPPLGDDLPYEWTRTDAAGKTETLVSRGPRAELQFPSAGKYRVQLRAAGNVSPVLEVRAYRITLEAADGHVLQEAPLARLGGRTLPSPEWLAKCPERFRVVVEDHGAEVPASMAISVIGPDGTVLNGPVAHALEPHARGRASRPLVLLGDREDAAAPVSAPADPTLFALPRGRVLVDYRGTTAPAAGVGPLIVHEIPVRFFAVGNGFPPREELEKILDRRLEAAAGVWAPYGRRFVRASLEIVPPPRNLLLIRGRSAGVDAHGRTSRLGMLVDGIEASVPASWRGEGGPQMPASIAREFSRRINPAFAVDIYEKLLPSDREAVVLRVRRRDGRPVVLEPLREGQDVALGVARLAADLSDGCEITADPNLISLEELALLLGVRREGAEGIDLILAKDLCLDIESPAFFKYYPDDVFSPPLAGAALVSWRIADGSGAYPYALARILGSLLLPPGWHPRPEDTLFENPLSPEAGVGANKRVGPETGSRIRERGRGLAAKNDDTPRGTEQGGR